MKKCQKSSRGRLPWRLSCSLHMTIISNVFKEIWTYRLTKQTSHRHRNPPSPALWLVGVNRAIVIFYLRCTHTCTHSPAEASPVWSCRSLMWMDHPLSQRDSQCSSQTDNCLFRTKSKTTHTHTHTFHCSSSAMLITAVGVVWGCQTHLLWEDSGMSAVLQIRKIKGWGWMGGWSESRWMKMFQRNAKQTIDRRYHKGDKLWLCESGWRISGDKRLLKKEGQDTEGREALVLDEQMRGWRSERDWAPHERCGNEQKTFKTDTLWSATRTASSFKLNMKFEVKCRLVNN